MFRTVLHSVVFLAGLLAACWIGAGYLGSNPVGAAVVLVIVACYCAGGLELLRYRQATGSLRAAVQAADTAHTDLGGWLQRVPAGLRTAVRLRVQGERVALPVPVLTPYLVGLLVLLGMLGTLLGMMATLRGTGLALESATDLQAIRGSLGAPVEGLAVAFGTSIAGVATSAMLGLLAALCRRERLLAVQALDAEIATRLHPHTQAWQRAETFRMQQSQADLLPTLVDRLQAMTTAIEQRSEATHQHLLDTQERFHAKADAEHARLAAAVELALKDSVAASARAVGEALQPILQDTLRVIGADTAALQQQVGQAVAQQVDGVSQAFQQNQTANADTWRSALASQQQGNQALLQALQDTLEQLGTQHDQRAAGLMDALAARLDTTADRWATSQQAQDATHRALVDALGSALQQFTQQHHAQATALADTLGTRLQAHSDAAAGRWTDALAAQQAQATALAEHSQQALDEVARGFDTRAGALVDTLHQGQQDLQATLVARDAQRLDTWTAAFGGLTDQLGSQWAQAGADVAQRQQAICDALARTAQDISAQSQAHAQDTLAEISRLVQVAAEAPRAAAEVVAELRQKLSDSMVRDTAMLDERSRLLATLETLLDAVNHASTEQRTAVDALVTTSADLLDRVGSRFTEQLATETGKLGEVAAQVGGSAVEVAALADAFGGAMAEFGSASTSLGERLERIGTALDASLVRSDEQLAYYVGQAREVIDLSVLSQKQIIDELQQLGARRDAGEAAGA